MCGSDHFKSQHVDNFVLAIAFPLFFDSYITSLLFSFFKDSMKGCKLLGLTFPS